MLSIAVVDRKPMIWDNLHANDYDQRRLFLGPYNRDVKIIPHIKGIFTNPNTELEANFNAFYTLGLWIKSGLGTVYEPRAALAESIREWIMEFRVFRRPDNFSFVSNANAPLPSRAGAVSKSLDINLVNTVANTILTDKDLLLNRYVIFIVN